VVIGRDNSKELKQVVLVLEQMAADMKEFAILLMGYPQMYRQPYGAYLYWTSIFLVAKWRGTKLRLGSTRRTTLCCSVNILRITCWYDWSISETKRASEDHKLFLLHDKHQNRPVARREVPRITAVDLLSRSWSIMLRGKFEVFCWRSLIPPYYSYIYPCEFVRHQNSTP
jgi:hypothetical protein